MNNDVNTNDSNGSNNCINNYGSLQLLCHDNGIAGNDDVRDDNDDNLHPQQTPLLLPQQDQQGQHCYVSQPLYYSVIFILIIEMMERMTYYGIINSETSYLTGMYSNANQHRSNRDWYPHMTAVIASSYTSTAIGIAYTSPFLGGIVADTILGDYWAIILGVSTLYIPGVILIAITTIPNMFGWDTFNRTALTMGMLFLMPMGTGFIKAIVNGAYSCIVASCVFPIVLCLESESISHWYLLSNHITSDMYFIVFGAKQYHPIHQVEQIESYYVTFYMVIIVGAFSGGIIVPIVASQMNIEIAYMIPVVCLIIGFMVFVSGTNRYIKQQPVPIAILWQRLCLLLHHHASWTRTLMSTTTTTSTVPTTPSLSSIPFESSFLQMMDHQNVDNENTHRRLLSIIPLSCLVLPFTILFAQIPTVFILQGHAMKSMYYNGIIDASIMACSLSIFGFISCVILTTYIYPTLASPRYNIRIPTTYKYAIGTTFAAIAIMCSMVVDYSIKLSYYHTINNGNNEQQQIPVTYQIFQFMFLAMGEVFVFPTSYEVAYTVSPTNTKSIASSIQLFFSIGLANFICVGLYYICGQWFPTSTIPTTVTTTIAGPTTTTMMGRTEAYAESELQKFMMVLLGIATFGIILNLSPPIKNWVERLRLEATNTAIAKNEHPNGRTE
jgi:POT family proton-dependent oligopeptide transporter